MDDRKSKYESINLPYLQILTSQICKNKEILYIMKATGIVRRIDDLGRVVIPKEIRRTMRIREGDPLEIYTDREGEVIFKKYSPIGELMEFASEYAETLFRTCGMPVAVCDKDCVIACAGISKKEFVDRKHSQEMESVIEGRSLYTAPAFADKRIPLTDENPNYYISCAMPIFTEGDVIGCVASIGSTDGKYALPASEIETKLIQTAASFLGRQLEA